jgi:23S rRNA (guanosine2251-2'-O)-methyltransferase
MRKLKLEELNRPENEEYKKLDKNPVVLVLDNIRSMHNVGSTFRSADAFLVEKIWLCGITATPPNREINKAALGATESVEWGYVEKGEELVADLKEKGYKVICLEQTSGSIFMQDYKLDSDTKYCFVFGNEVFGVDDKIIALADACVEIPQFGTKHSLNVSVSVGITLWDYFIKTNR